MSLLFSCCSSAGHRRAIPKLSHRDASHALNDHAQRSQAVAIGPRTADDRVQVASTYGAERQRRVVVSAGMMSVRGKIQREGEVVHLVAHHLTDLSVDLASVGERDGGLCGSVKPDSNRARMTQIEPECRELQISALASDIRH
jgi:hypothetical protein